MRPLLVLFALLAGCAFNVGVRAGTRAAETTEALTGVRSTLLGAGLRNGTVRVTGAARTGASATATVGGLVSGGGEIVYTLGFRALAGGIVALDATPGSETSWLETLAVEVPAPASVDLDVLGGDVEVTGVTGLVRVHTVNESILVRGATEVDLSAAGGTIDVVAERGRVVTEGGEIVLAVTGEIDAESVGGAIRGTFGGGTIGGQGGAVDVTLRGAPTRDVSLSTTGASLTLGVTAGASLVLDVEVSAGSYTLDTGGFHDEGTGRFVRTLGAGGPTVFLRTSGGSITVVER